MVIDGNHGSSQLKVLTVLTCLAIRFFECEIHIFWLCTYMYVY